jgi:hypothetical protein
MKPSIAGKNIFKSSAFKMKFRSTKRLKYTPTAKLQSFKGSVQQKPTEVKSDINPKHMISSIPAGYFKKFKGPCPFI